MSNKINSIKDLDKLVIRKLPVTEKQKSIVQRRLNKLKRDPKGFVEGSLQKRSKQIREHLPIKYNGSNSFTVISAVYNVEKYLDDYFSSLTNQSLSFKKHIKLILVDDGSTDNSASIIKKWQKKYPKNITYLYKENGGQASARNKGLKYVTTKWVTFIDSDDFISLNYFEEVDKFVEGNDEVSIISCPFIVYLEDKQSTKNNHPLNFRFSNDNRLIKLGSLNRDIQLSVNNAFFNYNIIKDNNIVFNEKVKPSFEDARFVGDYIVKESKSKNIAFLAQNTCKYLYRKRSDGTSTLDGAWLKPGLFSEVLEYGVLELLVSSEFELGYVPVVFQNMALYHLYWYFARIIDSRSSLSHLSSSEIELFKYLVERIFQKIEPETIERFNYASAWFFHKVGFLGLFKQQAPKNQIVYIENYDCNKDQILVKFFSNKDLLEEYNIDDQDITPKFYKKVEHTFIDDVFTYEYRVWVPCNELGSLKVFLDSVQTVITFNGKQHKSLNLSEVKKHFSRNYSNLPELWMFIDSNYKADDNAEHLYRYVKENSNKNICFALERDSKDWNRLYQEGFELVEFGTADYEKRLKQATKIISSNIDGYVTDYFGDNSLFNKDLIFLQHGVTLHNISKWLNTKKSLNLFITATNDEYNSITSDKSPYIFTDKEVKLTGFPRHDALLKNSKKGLKKILIMPTWRKNLVGESVDTNKRLYNPEFKNSDFFIHWKGLLDSSYISDLILNQGFQVIFAPHPNIQDYIEDFSVPPYIDVWNYGNGGVQELFGESDILITDYSSVAFEMAYLNKPVLYFQFDKNTIFSGGHNFDSGYFSYENDGFGPVAEDLNSLIVNLRSVVENNCDAMNIYQSCIESTFAYRDSNNCERVYQEILKLDLPSNQTIDLDLLELFMLRAYEFRDWKLVELRSKLLLGYYKDTKLKEIYLESLLEQHKLSRLNKEIQSLCSNEEKRLWSFRLSFKASDWKKALSFSKNISDYKSQDLLRLVQCYAEIGDNSSYESTLSKLFDDPLNKVQPEIIDIWRFQSLQEWQNLIDYAESNLQLLSEHVLEEYCPEIILAEAYRNIGDISMARDTLLKISSRNSLKGRFNIELAIIEYNRKNYSRSAGQFLKGIDSNVGLLKLDYAKQYTEALYNVANELNTGNKWLEVNEQLLQLIEKYPDERVIQKYFLKTLGRIGNWQDILYYFNSFNIGDDESVIYEVVLAQYRLGYLNEAYESIRGNNLGAQSSYDYISLVAEISFIMEDIDLSKKCYQLLISKYPKINKEKNILALKELIFNKK